MAAANVPDNLTASLTFFKGDDSVSRRQRIASAETENLSFSLSQGLVVFGDIIFRHLQQNLEQRHQRSLLQTLTVKIKPSTVCPQSRFVAPTEDNFEELARRSFAHAVIRQRLSPDAVRIPFVVYITEAASVRSSTVGASGLRRATTARVQEAQGETVAALRANPQIFLKEQALAKSPLIFGLEPGREIPMRGRSTYANYLRATTSDKPFASITFKRITKPNRDNRLRCRSGSIEQNRWHDILHCARSLAYHATIYSMVSYHVFVSNLDHPFWFRRWK